MRISRVTKVPLVVISGTASLGRHWQHHLDLSAGLWSSRKIIVTELSGDKEQQRACALLLPPFREPEMQQQVASSQNQLI